MSKTEAFVIVTVFGLIVGFLSMIAWRAQDGYNLWVEKLALDTGNVLYQDDESVVVEYER